MSEGKKTIKINRRKEEPAKEAVEQVVEPVKEVKEAKENTIKDINDIEIPDIEIVEQELKQKPTGSVIKEQQVEKRKLFANKKANIALAVLTAVIIVVFAILILF